MPASFPGADKKVSIDINAKVTEPAGAIPVAEVGTFIIGNCKIARYKGNK
ncbi:hypothetical protein QBE55_13960 [Eubacteriales bacterium mix99]|jgi:hypothetical protein